MVVEKRKTAGANIPVEAFKNDHLSLLKPGKYHNYSPFVMLKLSSLSTMFFQRINGKTLITMNIKCTLSLSKQTCFLAT